MRSLTLTSAATACVADIVPGGRIGAVAVDPDDGTVYVAHEREDDEGGVRVEVLALKTGLGGRYDGDVSCRRQGCHANVDHLPARADIPEHSILHLARKSAV